MQIVIDIPEEKYEYIKGLYKACTDYQTTLMLYDAVRNGIPLPKGHGRLIDANTIKPSHVLAMNDMYGTFRENAFRQDINDAPTVVKADKERAE